MNPRGYPRSEPRIPRPEHEIAHDQVRRLPSGQRFAKVPEDKAVAIDSTGQVGHVHREGRAFSIFRHAIPALHVGREHDIEHGTIEDRVCAALSGGELEG